MSCQVANVQSNCGGNLKCKLESELRCPTCKKWFQTPLLLPCGHSMCSSCATTTLLSIDEATCTATAAIINAGGSSSSGNNCPSSSNSGENNTIEPDLDDQVSLVSETDSGVVVSSRPGSYVGPATSVANLYIQVSQGPPVHGLVCPLCRRVSLLDAKGVDCLPRNRALENVVEKFAADLDTEKPVLCQICDDSETVQPMEASTMCEQCEIYYCQDCLLRCHPNRGPLAKHSLHSAGEGREVLRQKRRQRSSRCADHTQEALSLYCLSCRQAVCCICLQEGHVKHEAQPLNQICKLQKAELSQLLQALSEKAKTGTEYIQSLKTMSEKISPNSKKFEAEVVHQIDEMMAALQEKKQSLLDHVSNEREHKVRTFKEQITQSTTVLTKSTGLLQFCIEMLKESDTTAFLQISHTLINRVSLVEQTFHQEMEMRPRVSPDFEIKVDTEELEKKIRSLGFNEFKAPGIPIFSPEECSSERNVITVVWRPCLGSTVDFYTLDVDDGASGTFRKVYRGPDTMCTIEGLHFKAIYQVRVRAHNQAGESPYTESLCLQTADRAWFILDINNAPPELIFSNNNLTVTSQIGEDRVVLGGTGLSRGVHYWEFTVDRFDGHAQAAFGVAKFDCCKDMMLGRDNKGWAVYIDSKRSWFMHANDHFERTDGGIRQGSVVGVRLDCDKGTLSYYVNDEPHGPIAFMGLKGTFYPAMSISRSAQLTLHPGIEVPSESEESGEEDDSK